MKPCLGLSVGITLLCNIMLMAQKTSAGDLFSSYESHFKIHREQVYLNLNKDHFLSSEQIYFTGYVFNQQTSLPQRIPTNLYVGLYDNQGRQLQKSMWHVSDGVAHGSIKLSSEYKHGTYYVKADTRWMMNFYPRTHSVRKIQISEYDQVRRDDKPGNYSIRISAEGGKPVSELINTIGFHVANENRSGIEIKDGKIVNSKGKVILENLQSNEFGMGKFDMFIREGEEYFCELTTLNNQVLRKKIPSPEREGFALNVTGNSLKRIISIRANPNSFKKFRNKRLVLFVHRKGKIQKIPFSLDAAFKSFSLHKTDLLEGVNIVSLMTDKGEALGERVIYNSAQVWKNELELKITEHSQVKDSLYLDIKLKNPIKEQVTLSISILAEETINSERKETIQEAFLLRPYIAKGIEFSPWLFQTTDNQIFMNLDLLMLIYGKSNFSWSLLKEENQTFSHPFENGISVTGQIKNKNLNKIKSVLMYQDNIQGMKSAEIDENGFFLISNAFLRKEHLVHFSLMNEKNKLEKPELDVKFSPKMYIDSLDISESEKKMDSVNTNGVAPFDLNSWLENKRNYYLDEIVLNAQTQQEEPNRNASLKTGLWNAEKISEEDVIRKRSLSNYLRSLGFKLMTDPVTGWLFVLPRQSLNPVIKPPSIYLDGFRLFGGLPDYQLDNIDEVYYEHAGLMESNGGTIFIYLLQGARTGTKNSNRFTSVLASEGFDSPAEFGGFMGEDNVDLIFRKYGCVHWEPKATVKKNGEVRIKFRGLGLNRFKVIIEGISADGKLYSKTEVLESSTQYN